MVFYLSRRKNKNNIKRIKKNKNSKNNIERIKKEKRDEKIADDAAVTLCKTI